jgi:hypothetical protein
MKEGWARRRWFDFRQGHSVYLIFLLSLSNFILIFHRLLVERVEFLNQIFSELWLFVLIFFIAYIPIAIGIGAWHRRTQLRIDAEQAMRQNPFMAKMFRVLIDIQTGKISEKETESVRNFLKSIEDKGEKISNQKP